MFSVGVSDHIMIAHSLRGETFGPAQRLHGATYEVRIELRSPELDRDGIVADIGLLSTALREVLQPGDCVLVKGSRAMLLEQVAEALLRIPV